MLTKIKYDVIIINMSKQFIAKYTPEAEQELPERYKIQAMANIEKYIRSDINE